ncbi:S8 family serine peptidase [Microaerobacter geothermalis]|uniref:S8 family serine peptidase n=1 Tax=Microaerobacter geothermalis TaxID=674972 RepID=UPI001F1DDB76|nr:S8 family serine peptidase [Microaerobacter geothermalis]MCF6093388.1 S8 family serine peptidase [Microaerobacter geothermalis]
MGLKKLRRLILGMGVLSIALQLFFPISAYAELKKPENLQHNLSQTEWIVKWKGEVSQSFLKSVEVLAKNESENIWLVRPRQISSREELEQWRLSWLTHPQVGYIQSNGKVHVFAMPNDPEAVKQNYLNQIKAVEGWDQQNKSPDVTVAVVDTGVDLRHPDLIPNLVAGINLLEANAPPQDDNGHGTHVAGIVAAVGNNGVGVTGVSWKAKIMPIKALDKNGEGDEFLVGEGIKQAVNNGANIVLLSLGDPIYSPYMEEAVRYAEEEGVLVISATGNKGDRVEYPAAFPKVLSVGAVDTRDRVTPYSNYGPELDVVAPGKNIYTTVLGGKYGYAADGTSMAAPQVAGMAALLWAQNPKWTPAQIRQQIMSTTDDLDKPGWDMKSGYGRINITKALTTPFPQDIHEPNDRIDKAKSLTISTERFGILSGKDDVDWYRIDAPYAGELSLNIDFPQIFESGVNIVYFPGGITSGIMYKSKESTRIRLEIPKGTSYIQVKYDIMEENTGNLNYRLETGFQIHADPYEPNDSREKAKGIAFNESLTGTIHSSTDVDWFKLNIPKKGKLTIQVNTDTLRMDPVIYILKEGDQDGLSIDNQGISSGSQDEQVTLQVSEGTYFIRITDFYSNPVNGEYQLITSFVPDFIDVYEPNDLSVQAAPIGFNRTIQGSLSTAADFDWYRFQISQEQLIDIQAWDIPPNIGLRATWFDSNLNVVAEKKLGRNEDTLQLIKPVPQGIYFLRIMGDKSTENQPYSFMLTRYNSYGGFTDISSHWAKESIAQLSKEKVINGYQDFTFRPNQPITRAQVAAILVRTLNKTDVEQKPFNFSDVKKGYWAYDSLKQAYYLGILSGYDDGTLRPDQPISRAEMAVMVARAANLDLPLFILRPSFTDVPRKHWAAKEIQAMSKNGYINGYTDGSFKPNGRATRAEFAVIIERIWFKQ